MEIDLDECRSRQKKLKQQSNTAYLFSFLLLVSGVIVLASWWHLDSAGTFTHVQTTVASAPAPVETSFSKLWFLVSGPTLQTVFMLLATGAFLYLLTKGHLAIMISTAVFFGIGIMVISTVAGQMEKSRHAPDPNSPRGFLVQLAEENRLAELSEAAGVVVGKPEATYIQAQIEYLRGNAPGVRTNLNELAKFGFADWQPDWSRYHAMEVFAGEVVQQPQSQQFGQENDFNRLIAGVSGLILLGIASIFFGFGWKTGKHSDQHAAHARELAEKANRGNDASPSHNHANGMFSADRDPNWVPAWKRPPQSNNARRGSSSRSSDHSDSGSGLLTGLAAGAILSSGSSSNGSDACGGGGGGDGGGSCGGGGD